jgi:hypothetical protein
MAKGCFPTTRRVIRKTGGHVLSIKFDMRIDCVQEEDVMAYPWAREKKWEERR